MRIVLYPFLFIVLFLSACRDVKIIRERERAAIDPFSVDKEEGFSVDALKEYVKLVDEKTLAIIKIRKDIEADKTALDASYSKLANVNLLDAHLDVDVALSKDYHDYRDGAAKLTAKILAADLPTKVSETSEISTSAQTEERKLTDSIKVRKLVDEVEASATLAEAEGKKVSDVKLDIAQQEKALLEKITNAAKNFRALYGAKRVIALDAVITKIPDAKSLKEVEQDLLNDPQFFSLKSEVANVPVHGQRFLDLYEGNLPHVQPVVKEEMNRIVAEAKRQKQAIDDLFDGTVPAPTSQDELDSHARVVDGKLGTTELLAYASTRGVRRAETERQAAFQKIMVPVVANSGGPPPNIPQPARSIKNYEDAIGKIETKLKVSAATTKFNNAYRLLERVYDPTKLTALKTAVSQAANTASARYAPTFNNISDVLEPYGIEGLKARLEAGGLVNGSENEYEFYKNFLIIMKSALDPVLFTKLQKKIAQRIEDRVKFLKQAIVTTHPTLVAIEHELSKVDAITTEVALNNACTVIDNNLVAYTKVRIPCAAIARDLSTDMASADKSKLFWDRTILNNTKVKIKGQFSRALERIESAGLKEEKVKIKILDKEDEYDIPKGVTDLTRGVNEFNNSYLNAVHFVDIAMLPPTDHYTISLLIADMVTFLRTENLGTARAPMTYADVLGKYEDELYAGMSVKEIQDLGLAIDKASNHRLAKLHLVLSEKAYDAIMSPFTAPPESLVVQNMIDASLGFLADGTPEGAGIADFKAAIQAVFDAVDDVGSANAIRFSMPFFKNMNPDLLRDKVLAAALVTGVDHSADFSAAGQLGVLDVMVKNNAAYKNLSAVAAINPANLADVFIDVKGAVHIGKSLVERAGPDLTPVRYAIPETMRRVVFGSAGNGSITVMDEFNQLRDELKLSLEALKTDALSRGMPVLPSHQNVQPMVNAFNLVFAYPVSELLKLKFDGTDDAAIAAIFAMWDDEMADRFTRLKDVVGENHVVTGDKREIFKMLGGTALPMVQPGLKDKVLGGSVSPETLTIQRQVVNFLK